MSTTIHKNLYKVMRGDTYRLTSEYPIDATAVGKVLTTTIKYHPSMPDPGQLQKSILITDEMVQDKRYAIDLFPIDTIKLEATVHFYDMQVTGTSQDVLTIQHGRFQVIEHVTHMVPLGADGDAGLVVVGSYEYDQFAMVAAS